MDSEKELFLRERSQAWEAFINSGEIKNGIISPSIAESWLKCANTGVNPTNGKGQIVLEYGVLSQLIEKNDIMIRAAKPFMQDIYKFFKGSSFIVVLTDAKGHILEIFGDYDRLENAKRLNFLPGAIWQESVVGTNAIAMVLDTGLPIQVSGPEHFCLRHHGWTCSAAPITGQNGEVVGVLDVSGCARSSYSHTLGMVAAAAVAISRQLKIQQKHNELAMANKRLSSIFNTVSEGVILIDKFGVVNEINMVVRDILEKPSGEVVGHPIERIFGNEAPFTRRMLCNNEAYKDVELFLPRKQGVSHCIASGEPITDEYGALGGGIIVLRPVKRVRSFSRRNDLHSTTFAFSDIIGNSSQITEAVRVASLAADSMANVLLQGESGTGKEVFAQAIHGRSARCDGPFVAVNCGAIPRELIGSELFGYEEGAFTGAKRGGRAGKFELASGGTLFLDEIGDMPLEQQVVLLRVLQEKKVTRIGSDRTISTDVRVICATNKHLPAEIERGAFRRDLYYRLNVISITIPPLRERNEDVGLLFQYFVDKMGRERGRSFMVEKDVLGYLQRYDWPGNVRELQNVVERAASLAQDDMIMLKNLPREICNAGKPKEYGTMLGKLDFSEVVRMVSHRELTRQQMEKKEREEIAVLLSECGGNISAVAKRLGVARSTIYRKLRSYELEG